MSNGIGGLTRVTTIGPGDAIALSSSYVGGDASISFSAFMAAVNAAIQSSSVAQTLYAAPNGTGFTISPIPFVPGSDVLLLMTPVADYAAGSIILPATPGDGQKYTVSSTHAVAALTINGNGSAVNGAPTVLVAGGFFTLRYDGVTASWYRIG